MKLRWIVVVSTLAWLWTAAPVLRAQADPTAVRPITEEAGGGFSYARPDIGETYIKGFSLFANAMYHRRAGLEFDWHDVNVLTPTDVGESTFMLGPIVSVIHEDRMNLYVRGTAGLGRIVFKPNFFVPQTDNYFVYAIGGGIEFRATKRINIRAVDVEEQWWSKYPTHGLNPMVVTFGAGYVF